VATFYTDNHIAFDTAVELQALGHTVVRCQALGLKDADDEERLRASARNGWILLTHDKGFRLLNKAWHVWAAEWGVDAHHAGILIVPQESSWPPARAAQEIDQFVQRTAANQLSGACYRAHRAGSWQRQ
jgi:hypothetical protein